MTDRNHNILPLVLYGCICIFLSGCDRSRSSDFMVMLPNQYILLCANSETIVIFTPDTPLGQDCIIGPTISRMQISGDIVYGEAVNSPLATAPPSSPFGYFVVDTKSQKVDAGLSETEWRKILEQSGVSSPKPLVRPSKLR